ncbi:substrate-binding domain-containing protein [Bauldia litoralis]|uniref:Inositol transport system substrate-binding protein n=1 Tax=Bauldia litoralis TaxID=665467 RepID=A0A1G6AW22_9HYPH|nr:inositol transport system substrate-binding protein [Bauldia litoralis]
MEMKFLKKVMPAAAVAALLSTGVQAQDLTIATSVPSLGFPFFVHMQKELAAGAEALGGISLISTDGENKTPKQTADVEAAIIQGVDGIVISPIDAVAMAPALQQAVDAGVPVVTIDRAVQGVPGILAHVGADNVKGGEAQANLIVELFPDGANIVNLQGQPGASPAIDRNKGVHNVLDGMADKYKFVAEQTANFAREEGASVTEAILAGLDSPPDVIVAANDDMALGALQVTSEQGLDIPIIGFDALPEALGSVRDGGLAATIEQFPGGQSRGAMDALVKYLRDGTKPEAVILLTPIAITKDNINDAERLGELN